MVRWFAFANDGISLSPKRGRMTRKKAAADCRKDRQDYIRETGYNPDSYYTWYVEKQRITKDSVKVLKCYNIIFGGKAK